MDALLLITALSVRVGREALELAGPGFGRKETGSNYGCDFNSGC